MMFMSYTDLFLDFLAIGLVFSSWDFKIEYHNVEIELG